MIDRDEWDEWMKGEQWTPEQIREIKLLRENDEKNSQDAS